MRKRGAVSADRLTAREREVLAALATGLSSDEVAEHLSIGPQAVRADLKRVMAKLDARTKLEALIIAIRAGLIDPPPC